MAADGDPVYPNEVGAAPVRGSNTRDPQPWSTTTTPGAPVTDEGGELDLADRENTRTRSPSVIPSLAASTGLSTAWFPCPPGAGREGR